MRSTTNPIFHAPMRPSPGSPRASGRVSRSRWAALGAAIAVTVGTGGLMTASASIGSGERAVFVPITPCRIMDTRPSPLQVGSRSTPLGPGEVHTIQTRGTNGNCTLPADAAGLVMNVAAVSPTAGSYLTVYPAGAPRPVAANLNWVAGQPPVSNAVTVDIADDGRVSFYNYAGSVDLTADVVGYYTDHHHEEYAMKPTGPETLLVSLNEFDQNLYGLDPAILRRVASPTALPEDQSDCGAAPLHLADGSRVTKVGFRVVDESAVDDVGGSLVRRRLDDTAAVEVTPYVSSSGAPGEVALVSTPAGDAVIDNSRYVYELLVCGGLAESDTMFYGAAVAYTHPE